MLSPVYWKEDGICLIDQTKLPHEEVWLTIRTVEELAQAIRTLMVRGAPAIGIAAAFGCALAVKRYSGDDALKAAYEIRAAADFLSQTRPTAVNLFWALNRIRSRSEQLLAEGATADALRAGILAEAEAIRTEDIAACRAIGKNGAVLLPDQVTILTHCNAGSLATGGYGTALGVIRTAHEMGKNVHVYADETRPLLQGARLTVWELMRDGIEVTLICDNMSGALMRQGRIDACLVGADRIARNGDTANKIGTYTVAVLARQHGIPFYVAAPFSTVDHACASGDEIQIEQRDPTEVISPAGVPIAPAGVAVWNPAFDITPETLITAIITERGVVQQPDLAQGLQHLANVP
jgi:methylthioribose-1-phosphate isomerase